MIDYDDLAEYLGLERGEVPAASAAAALRFYAAGKSVELASRETGVPGKQIMRWVEMLGMKRSKEQTQQVLRAKATAQAVRERSR